MRILILLFFACLGCTSSKYYGAENKKCNKPIGILDHPVTNAGKINVINTYDELVIALEQTEPFGKIKISDKAIIDITGKPALTIKEGIHIEGGRTSTTLGALIFTTNLDHSPAIECIGNNVRISGLRLQGPDSSRRIEQMYALIAHNAYYDLPFSFGIWCHNFNNLIVENCELFGWSYAAVSMKNSNGNIIKHNYIHHNQRLGLGYGVALDDAFALIEYNFFNWNRHSIAGSGRLNTGYEICNNIFGERSLNYVIDMHGIYDERVRDTIGGSQLKIHHNTFYTVEDGAMVFHGDPIQPIRIFNNIFIGNHINKAVTKGIYFKKGKIITQNNLYVQQQGQLLECKVSLFVNEDSSKIHKLKIKI